MEGNCIGVRVNNEELNSYIFGLNGFSVSEGIVYAFTDQYGNFDRELMEEQLSVLKSSDSNEWKDLENFFREARLAEKLMSIYNMGLYLNSMELEEISNLFTSKKNLSYLLEPYYSTKNDGVCTTDSELKEYLKKHQFDSEYNVYNEEREAIIVSIPNDEGENYISYLLQRIQDHLATTAREYDKLEVFTKIIN